LEERAEELVAEVPALSVVVDGEHAGRHEGREGSGGGDRGALLAVHEVGDGLEHAGFPCGAPALDPDDGEGADPPEEGETRDPVHEEEALGFGQGEPPEELVDLRDAPVLLDVAVREEVVAGDRGNHGLGHAGELDRAGLDLDDSPHVGTGGEVDRIAVHVAPGNISGLLGPLADVELDHRDVAAVRAFLLVEPRDLEQEVRPRAPRRAHEDPLVAPDDVDRRNATDMVVRLSGGDVAVRLRRADCDYRDLTIRSKRDSGYRTELSKIRDGFGDWYLYGWLDGRNHISEWILVDLDELRTKQLWRGRREIPNGDGTWFIPIAADELKRCGCLVADKLGEPVPF